MRQIHQMATMTYRFNRLSDAAINGEIKRLGDLLEMVEDRWNQRQTLWKHRRIIEMLLNANAEGIPTSTSKYTLAKNFYETNIKYLKTKRRFWSQHRDNSMDKDALEKLQEEMAEWITNGWAYLGMEEHEEQNENVKEEFQMFKLMFENTPKKQKRKKNKK